jgi:hypothetical protein
MFRFVQTAGTKDGLCGSESDSEVVISEPVVSSLGVVSALFGVG